MAVTKGLGRGLDALFGDFQAEANQQITTLPIQKVEPNPLQPRRDFDSDQLQALSESISQHGVIQPLCVRQLETGYYQIIAGERRWRAARLAGLQEIPVIVIQADDRTAAELALIENLQRTDLNPMEEAKGYEQLLTEFSLTQETVAEHVGRSRSSVTNALRLLTLPDEIAEMVASGALSAGHARAILKIKSKAGQLDAAKKMIALQLSVRQAESMCSRLAAEQPEKEPQLGVDYTAECAKQLSSRLGRNVVIVSGKRKGRIELEYYGQDDLQLLFEALQKLDIVKRKEAHHGSKS